VMTSRGRLETLKVPLENRRMRRSGMYTRTTRGEKSGDGAGGGKLLYGDVRTGRNWRLIRQIRGSQSKEKEEDQSKVH